MGYKLAKVFEHSMEPTLHEGDLLLIRTKCKVAESDVVVAKDPEGSFVVKRVLDIDEETMFLIGDNPEGSIDSRSYGRIPIIDVIGKVLFKWNIREGLMRASKR